MSTDQALTGVVATVETAAPEQTAAQPTPSIPVCGKLVHIPPTGMPLEEIEREALVEALQMANWCQKDAAELLSISPRVMNYKIKTLGIEYPPGMAPGHQRGRKPKPLT